jgi:hypothetical protein
MSSMHAKQSDGGNPRSDSPSRGLFFDAERRKRGFFAYEVRLDCKPARRRF